jgi:hypothetical protein
VGSLSNVIGYQSVKSTVMNDSPLFTIRTRRATNHQQTIITSHYLGIGKENLFQFSIINDRNELLRKFIEIINKIDDTTFERFIERCIQKIRQDDSFNCVDSHEISRMIHQLRTKHYTDMNIVISEYNSQTKSQILPTGTFTACNHWQPGCFLRIIILKIVFFFIEIFQRPTVAWLCWHSGQVPCNIVI